MFTGIVTDIGEIVSVEARERLRRLTVASRYDADGIVQGASICHDGVCLTVIDVAIVDGRTRHVVECAAETLAVTTAGNWRVGTRLNLERALKIGDELGGHIVTGHVDGIADVADRVDADAQSTFTLALPPSLARFVAPKGSVCLDGISLTVNTVVGNSFTVHLIPHTLAVTTWGAVRAGDRANVEVDLMARYAARLAETR